MEKKTYSVTIPFAGHIGVQVEANSEEEAINIALEQHLSLDDVIEWEALREFNRGNVCCCPSPWEAEADEE